MRSPPLEKIPAIIKTMATDDVTLFVGTSQGMVVAIPITSLDKCSEDIFGKQKIEETKETGVVDNTQSEKAMGENGDEQYFDNCALALHVQKDSRVRSLLHLRLPTSKPATHSDTADRVSQSSSQHELQHSVPSSTLVNPSSFGSGVDSSGMARPYRSLLVSSGKGHMEYSGDKNAEDTLKLPANYNSLREKNEEHQLLVWGHKL